MKSGFLQTYLDTFPSIQGFFTFNSSVVPNIQLYGGFSEPAVFDLDWASTIRGITSDGGELVIPKYAAGKAIWTVAKIVTALEVTGNPVPFTDPGERHAVGHGRWSF
jgi:hypothetical protein